MSAKVHNLFENLLSLEKKVMIYGYIRVSSDKQTVENQRFAINNSCTKQKLKIDGWIEETYSINKKVNYSHDDDMQVKIVRHKKYLISNTDYFS